MTYRIARNGQIFGPYTEAEVRGYLATGNIVLTDLAQAEGSTAWVPVGDLLGRAGAPTSGNVPRPAASPFVDPPDLPWWFALLLGIITGGLFFIVWDIVQAAWVRRVQPASNALALYIALGVLYLMKLPSSWHTIDYNAFSGPPVGPHHGFLLFLVWLGLFISSRIVIRQDVMRHFNGPEPIGLELNSFLVFLLGGLYLQYHFNRINELKRLRQVGVPA